MLTIKGLTGLKILNLQGNQISSQGASHLSGLQELTELYLSGNLLGDDGVQYLTKLEKLKNVANET